MWVCSSGNRKINITHRANSGNPQHVTGIPHKLICIIFDCFLLLYSIEKIQRLWIARQMLYSSGSHRARLFWTQVLQQWMRGERKYLPAMEVVAINTSIFKTVLISPPIYSTHIFSALAGSLKERTKAMEQRAKELFTLDGGARVSREILHQRSVATAGGVYALSILSADQEWHLDGPVAIDTHDGLPFG